MVNISNSAAKLISTAVNEKSGTTVKKFVTKSNYADGANKVLATVVEYGQNTPLKRRGIDTFVKIDGGNTWKEGLDRILMSGDEIILSGTSKAEYLKGQGDFNSRFKEMVDLLKQYPKLKANLIPNINSKGESQTIVEKLLRPGN